MLRDYFQHFTSASHEIRVKHSDVAQMFFNVQKSSSPDKSPFEISTGQQPLLLRAADIDQKQYMKSADLKQPVLKVKLPEMKVAEKILGYQTTQASRKHLQEYLVKWSGCNNNKNTQWLRGHRQIKWGRMSRAAAVLKPHVVNIYLIHEIDRK